MKTLTRDALIAVRGADVVDANGEKIGSVEDIYYDDATGRAEWIGIGVGFLGLKRRVVPVAGATLNDDVVQVQYDKDLVKESPDVDPDDIEPGLERELYTYYGLTGRGAGGGTLSQRDVDYGGADADRDMVRSEEELRVGKERVESGKVRLRKWVDTEPVERDVELRRETVEVHREPIDRPAAAGDIGEDEIDVTLQAERPVVQKDVVARERISLEKDVETEHETISDEVRRERVEVEGDVDERRR